jgi:hypothetical protein
MATIYMINGPYSRVRLLLRTLSGRQRTWLIIVLLNIFSWYLTSTYPTFSSLQVCIALGSLASIGLRFYAYSALQPRQSYRAKSTATYRSTTAIRNICRSLDSDLVLRHRLDIIRLLTVLEGNQLSVEKPELGPTEQDGHKAGRISQSNLSSRWCWLIGAMVLESILLRLYLSLFPVLDATSFQLKAISAVVLGALLVAYTMTMNPVVTESLHRERGLWTIQIPIYNRTFSKASNMDYRLDSSLRVANEMLQHRAEQCAERGCTQHNLNIEAIVRREVVEIPVTALVEDLDSFTQYPCPVYARLLTPIYTKHRVRNRWYKQALQTLTDTRSFRSKLSHFEAARELFRIYTEISVEQAIRDNERDETRLSDIHRQRDNQDLNLKDWQNNDKQTEEVARHISTRVIRKRRPFIPLRERRPFIPLREFTSHDILPFRFREHIKNETRIRQVRADAIRRSLTPDQAQRLLELSYSYSHSYQMSERDAQSLSAILVQVKDTSMVEASDDHLKKQCCHAVSCWSSEQSCCTSTQWEDEGFEKDDISTADGVINRVNYDLHLPSRFMRDSYVPMTNSQASLFSQFPPLGTAIRRRSITSLFRPNNFIVQTKNSCFVCGTHCMTGRHHDQAPSCAYAIAMATERRSTAERCLTAGRSTAGTFSYEHYFSPHIRTQSSLVRESFLERTNSTNSKGSEYGIHEQTPKSPCDTASIGLSPFAAI